MASIQLKQGESVNLNTLMRTREGTVSGPMDRPVATVSGNDLRSFYAALRKAQR